MTVSVGCDEMEGPGRSPGGSFSSHPTDGASRRLCQRRRKPLPEQQGELRHGSRPLRRGPLPRRRTVLDGQIDQLLRRLLIGKQRARLDDLPYSAVESLDAIGRLDQRPNLRRELKKRYDLSPNPTPGLCNSRIFPAHGGLLKRLQSLLRSSFVHCLINRFQSLADNRSILVGNECCGRTDQVHDACLVQGLRKHRFECFRHPLEAIGHRDENVLDAPILQLVENAGPKGRSFIFRKPHPQDL